MATHQEIKDSLLFFLANYQKNERLKIMNQDWDRVINIRANDIVSECSMVLEKGLLEVKEGASQNPDLTVEANSEILADLFYGDITPTEPYLNGSLKILGSEEDILRLDFISLLIWGE